MDAVTTPILIHLQKKDPTRTSENINESGNLIQCFTAEFTTKQAFEVYQLPHTSDLSFLVKKSLYIYGLRYLRNDCAAVHMFVNGISDHSTGTPP